MGSPAMVGLCMCGKYVQYATDDRIVSTIGFSGSIERCCECATGAWYAAKIISENTYQFHPGVVRNELAAYTTANACCVPRVVQLVDAFPNQGNGFCMILELVDGRSLASWSNTAARYLSAAQREQRVKQIAVQLLETLQALHEDAHIAHLDLSSNNIMLRNDQDQWYDDLRLINFEESEVKRISPEGCTYQYASPQQLYAVLRGMEGPVSATPPPHLTGYSNRRGCAYHKFLDKLSVCWQQPACCGDSHHEPACGNSDDEPEQQYMHDILVDGPAADMWSCGVLLYQLMVGELPFQLAGPPRKSKAPTWLPLELKDVWEQNEDMLFLQNQWGQEFRALFNSSIDYNVDHPVLNKIRAVSAEPEAAAEFLGRLLSPWECRMSARDAQNTDYLQDLKAELTRHRQEPPKACSSVPFILSDSKLTGASAPGRQPLPCRAPPQAAGIPNPKQLPGHSSAVSAAVSATAIDCCPAQHLRPHCRSLPCAVATKVAQSSYLCTKPNCSTAVSAGPCPRAMQCCPARHWSLHPQPTATVPGSFQTAVSGLVRAASATAALEGQPQRSCKQPVPTQHAQHPSDPAVSGFIAAYSGATAPEGVLLSEVKGKCSDRQKTPLLTELQPSSSTSQQHWNAPAQLAADGTKAALQSAKVPLTQAHPQAGVQDCWAGDSAEQASSCPGVQPGKPPAGKHTVKRMAQRVRATLKSCKKHVKSMLKAPSCCHGTATIG